MRMWVQINQQWWVPTGVDTASPFIAIKAENGNGVLVRSAETNGDVIDGFNTRQPATQLVAKMNSHETNKLQAMERLLRTMERLVAALEQRRE